MKQSIGDDDVYSQYRTLVLSDRKKASETFLKEVRERFRKETEKFIRFCSLMKDFANGRIDVASLEEEITKLLAGHNDLILKFNAFLPQDNDDNETPVDEDGVGKLVAAIDFMNNVRTHFQNDDEHVAEFMQIMKQIQEGQPLNKLRNKLAALFRDHGDLIEKFNGVAKEDSTSSTPKIIKQKQIVESIQELDLSQCEQISPSYWLLPKNYRTPLASFRSEMDAQVLNDTIVCVNQDSGNYSCNQAHRTLQEEILFRCENDRFELDILLEYNISAAKRVKNLINRIENKPESCSIEIGEHLSASDLRSIERLYGDYGLDVLENLRRNPAIAMPRVLNRLKEKYAELIESRSDFNEVWVRVSADAQDKLSNLRTEEDLMAESDDQFTEKEDRKPPMVPEILALSYDIPIINYNLI